ncbi:MAG: SCO family protein [Myxococcota bacterium]
MKLTRREVLVAGAALPLAARLAQAAPARGGFRYSDLLPDVGLVTSAGERVQFVRDCVRDARVVLGFSYVKCQGSCPATNLVFQKLQQDLAGTAGIRLFSITLDPEHDGPAELAAHARKLNATPQGARAPWEFLTGPKADIEALREALGYRDLDPAVDAVRSNHAAMITFGDDARNVWRALPARLPYATLLRAVRKVVRS